jgi:hypothetical protein
LSSVDEEVVCAGVLRDSELDISTASLVAGPRGQHMVWRVAEGAWVVMSRRTGLWHVTSDPLALVGAP